MGSSVLIPLDRKKTFDHLNAMVDRCYAKFMKIRQIIDNDNIESDSAFEMIREIAENMIESLDE
jgi:hypothetical protein